MHELSATIEDAHVDFEHLNARPQARRLLHGTGRVSQRRNEGHHDGAAVDPCAHGYKIAAKNQAAATR
jgi:hypothetical protein